MPSIQVQTPPVAAAEPVTLAQLAAWLRLDLDPALLLAVVNGDDLSAFDLQQVADLENLLDLRTAAREKVEAYTGRIYAPCTIAATFRLDEPYLLPAGATTVSVSGAFTELSQLDGVTDWLVEYQKGISVERELPLSEALQRTYTVVAEAVADTQFLGVAKAAMKELAAEWYRNRETSVDGRVAALPVSYQVKLAEARINPLGVPA